MIFSYNNPIKKIKNHLVSKILNDVFFYSLELNMELPEGPQGSRIETASTISQEQDELSQRLAKLRQTE